MKNNFFVSYEDSFMEDLIYYLLCVFKYLVILYGVVF